MRAKVLAQRSQIGQKPGFHDLDHQERTVIARAGGDFMRRLWSAAAATGSDIRLIVSWNEFIENSHIEPSANYGSTYVDVVRELAPIVGRALIIGHNPSMEDLAGQLAGAGSNSDAVRNLRAKFPTCGAAFLESDEQWNRWGGNCASLKRFWTPR